MAHHLWFTQRDKQTNKKEPFKIQCLCLVQTIFDLVSENLIHRIWIWVINATVWAIFLKEGGETEAFLPHNLCWRLMSQQEMPRVPFHIICLIERCSGFTHACSQQHLQRKSTEKSPQGAMTAGRLLSFIELKKEEYRVKTPSPKQEECTDCCYSYQITTPQGLIMR